MSTREYDDEGDPPVGVECPECEVGKHLNCNGQSWDHEQDRPAICPCWQDGHRSPLVSH